MSVDWACRNGFLPWFTCGMLTAVPLDNEEITGYVADRAMKIYMANLKIIDCEEVAEGSIEMKFIFDGVLRLSNQASDVRAVNHLVIEELNMRAYRFKLRPEFKDPF